MVSSSSPQSIRPRASPAASRLVAALKNDPAFLRVSQRIHDLRETTIVDQRSVVAIPGPTGGEGRRAAFMLHRLKEVGVRDIRIDEVGNVVGWLPSGQSSLAARPVIVAAHLDTVFADTTPLTMRTAGRRIFAPGISDNARGLAALITFAKAMVDSGMETVHPVLLVATVGEEGAGDLRGVKHLFREGSPFREAAAFIAVDGPGRDRIVTQAIGSLRYRIVITGAGGHSWGDRGLANAVHAMGLAVAKLRALAIRAQKDTALSVGRIGGGTSVNSIPEQAWMEIDIRSAKRTSLLRMESAVLGAVESAVTEENHSGSRGTLELHIERIGDRPAGRTRSDSALVQSAIAATRAIGSIPELAASSTDANVPISLGIPAVAIGTGGVGGRTHTLDEWYEDEGGPLGLERAALVICSAAGVRLAEAAR